MKPKTNRQQEATVRATSHSNLSLEARITKAEGRRGNSKRELARLLAVQQEAIDKAATKAAKAAREAAKSNSKRHH